MLRRLILSHGKPSPGPIGAGHHQDPYTFVPVTESFFILNKSETLQEYRFGVKICRMLIKYSLLQQQKPSLIVTVIANPNILSQEIFPPTTINLTDLCDTSLSPLLPWNPPFDLVHPLPTKVDPPVLTHNLPPTLLTMVPLSSALSTVSKNSFSTMPQPLIKMLPAKLICRALLLCYLPSADGTNPSPFPSTITPIHHTPQDASIQIPPNACILSPLHVTLDALICSKNSLEAIMSMLIRH